jgi:hypothetical protein
VKAARSLHGSELREEKGGRGVTLGRDNDVRGVWCSATRRRRGVRYGGQQSRGREGGDWCGVVT